VQIVLDILKEYIIKSYYIVFKDNISIASDIEEEYRRYI
jgi:hypothetical protein